MNPPRLIGAEVFAAPYLRALQRAEQAREQERASHVMLKALHRTYVYLLGIDDSPEVCRLRSEVAMAIVQAEQAGFSAWRGVEYGQETNTAD